MLKDWAAAQALEEVNAQRNHLAHGRKSLAVAEIKKLAVQGLKLQAWPQIPDKDGELILTDWHPWVVTSPSNCQLGLFERWQKNAIRYLVPDTGVVFKVRRS